MQVRRATPGDSTDDPTPGEWRSRSPRMAPWLRAALPGRAARAGADAVALAVALLVATLLRHDGRVRSGRGSRVARALRVRRGGAHARRHPVRPLHRPLVVRLLRGDRRAGQDRRAHHAGGLRPGHAARPAGAALGDHRGGPDRPGPDGRRAVRRTPAARPAPAAVARGRHPGGGDGRRRGRDPGRPGHAAQPASPYLPVALLDDDPAKRNLRDHGRAGRRATGTRWPTVVRRYGADAVLIAIPSAGADAGPRAHRAGRAARTSTCKVLPSVGELFGRHGQRRRHPPGHRRRPARPPRDRHRPRRDRRLPRRASGCWSPAPAGRSARSCAARSHRFAPGRAGHARPRRVGAARRAAVARRPGLLDDRNLVRRRHPRPRPARRGLRRAPARRSCSTPPRSSTCRCSSCTRPRRVKTNVWGTLARAARPRCGTASSRFVNISTDKAANPMQRARLLQADHRAAHRARRPTSRTGTFLQRPVRQRAGQPRLGAHRVRGADRRRAARSRSPTPTSPATS